MSAPIGSRLGTLIGTDTDLLTPRDAELLWSRLGVTDSGLHAEFMATVGSLAAGDEDATASLDLRVGRWRIDLTRQGIRSAVMAAALAAVLADRGLTDLGIGLASAILPSVIDIERVEISPSDRRLLLEIRLKPAFQDGFATEDGLYAALPAATRRVINRYDFADFVGRLRNADLVEEAESDTGEDEPWLRLRDPDRRPLLRIR